MIDVGAKSRLLSRSATPARLRRLDTEGIPYEHFHGDEYLVAGKFLLNASIGYWRSVDHEKSGYTIGGLVAAMRVGSVSAPGRDSVEAHGIDPDNQASVDSEGPSAEPVADNPPPKSKAKPPVVNRLGYK